MNLLVCSDLHLRYDLPRCRTDEDWIDTQKDQLRYIADTANQHNCPVVICGDIFHRPQVPDILKNIFLYVFSQVKNGVYIMAGQHDLLYHSWSNVRASSFGILWEMIETQSWINSVGDLGRFSNYGQPLQGTETGLYFLHTLVFPDAKSAPPGGEIDTAAEILKKCPKAKWVFAGDNHHGFYKRIGKKHVVVPGCINRQASDFKDYQPKMFLVDTEKDRCQRINITDDIEMIDDAYIIEDRDRKDRISAFIESINGNEAISFDFVENVDEARLANKSLSKGVLNIVDDLMEV